VRWFVRIVLLVLLANLELAWSGHAGATEARIVGEARAAAEWIAQALTSSGYAADFSLASLKEVDRFLDEQAPNGEPVAGGLLSQDLVVRLFALGAYVGEVINREGGGHWDGDDADPKSALNIVVILQDGSSIWPVQRVIRRFNSGAEGGIYAYGAQFLQH
jgi:hypothetical protein